MRLIDADEFRVFLDRQYHNCHGYMGNKKEIYREALRAVKSYVHDKGQIDAVEVVHARWTDENGNITGQFRFNFMCSNCKQYQHSPVAINGEDFAKKHKYCHNCGAKMDEVSE